MKRQTLLVMAGVAVISFIIAFVVANTLFGSPSPSKNPIKVPVVEPISPSFPSPAEEASYQKIFNKNALNPTQLIEIGENKNKEPFQNTSQ